jgi:hypothetical protein
MATSARVVQCDSPAWRLKESQQWKPERLRDWTGRQQAEEFKRGRWGQLSLGTARWAEKDVGRRRKEILLEDADLGRPFCVADQ